MPKRPSSKGRPGGREVEIKLAISDPKDILARLAKLGFRRDSSRKFERNALYDFPDERLRKQGCLVRLRFLPEKSVLTYKGGGPSGGRFKDRQEIESEVGDGARVAKILEALGLGVSFRYEKFRTTYRRAGDPEPAEVTFDETPIGVFLEIEGPRRWIRQVATGSGFRPEDYITASYGALYIEWCRAHQRKPGHMVFTATQRKTLEARGRAASREKP